MFAEQVAEERLGIFTADVEEAPAARGEERSAPIGEMSTFCNE